MNSTTAESIRAIYIAMSAALSDEGAALSRDILLAVADNPKMAAESRRLCRWIAETGQAATTKNHKPYLQLNSGGAA
jgi:hypothetical protein